MPTQPPQWKFEGSSWHSLDLYHKDLQNWFRTVHLEPADKMDMIINRLEGTAKMHIKMWLNPHTAYTHLRRWHRMTYGNTKYRNVVAANTKMPCPRVETPRSFELRYNGDPLHVAVENRG